MFVMTGGPVDLSKIKANSKVAAIMWCGYPGQAGGLVRLFNRPRGSGFGTAPLVRNGLRGGGAVNQHTTLCRFSLYLRWPWPAMYDHALILSHALSIRISFPQRPSPLLLLCQAMADAVFGRVNPGGRLPYTIYSAAFTKKCSMLDNGMRPNKTSGNPGRTYRFYTDKASGRGGGP